MQVDEWNDDLLVKRLRVTIDLAMKGKVTPYLGHLTSYVRIYPYMEILVLYML